jgi:hypothetical protein
MVSVVIGVISRYFGYPEVIATRTVTIGSFDELYDLMADLINEYSADSAVYTPLQPLS